MQYVALVVGLCHCVAKVLYRSFLESRPAAQGSFLLLARQLARPLVSGHISACTSRSSTMSDAPVRKDEGRSRKTRRDRSAATYLLQKHHRHREYSNRRCV